MYERGSAVSVLGKANPLQGMTVLITRAKNQNRELADKIENLGGKVIGFPVIRFDPPKKQQELDNALRLLDTFQWLIFTSVNGVEAFFQRMEQLQIDPSKIQQLKIVAIGPKTAQAIEKQNQNVFFVSPKFYAEGLLEALRPLILKGDKILFPRANIARDIIPRTLEQLGCQVVAVDAYDTVLDGENREEILRALRQNELDVITFTSSSTARYFVQLLKELEPNLFSLLKKVQIACIGPITANTVQELGMRADIIANPFTIDGLVQSIVKLRTKETDR